MINKQNWTTRNLGLAKYMLENGESDNLISCGKPKDNKNHLFYSFKKSDNSKKLYNDYIARHDDYREPTQREYVPVTFWVSVESIAKTLLHQGFTNELLGYLPDRKCEGKMIYLFAKTDEIYKAFIELKDGKDYGDKINE